MEQRRDEWGTQSGTQSGEGGARVVMRAMGLTLGAAALCLMVQIDPLSTASHLPIYHFDGPATGLFLPVLLNVAVLWGILTGLMVLGSRVGGRLKATIWTGLMLSLPWVALKEGMLVAMHPLGHAASVPLVALPFVAVIGVNLFWRPKLRLALERLVPACEVLLFALSLTGGLAVGKLLYLYARSAGMNDQMALHKSVGARPERMAGEPKRVIVILFDELSYEQTYGNRSAEVALPEFDRLAGEATIFRNVRPAADYTDRAVPSLLTGQTVTEIRASASGRTLEMQNALGWTRFDAQKTVFGDALKAGYETGLVGWYNPYCRILPEVLDRCEWRAHAILPNMTATDSPAEGRDVLANSVEPLRAMVERIPGFFVRRLRKDDSDEALTQRHVKDYEELSGAADSLLEDGAMTFVFLHLPVPHQGGIYDRRTHQLTRVSTSYLDNLALADEYLGHARRLLEERGDWDESTVVVMGDHSWRTWMWSGSLFWTEEDKAVTAGKVFDDRPAMVVKLPKGRDAAHIDTAFEAKRTRWLLDELMLGRIGTEGELAKWVEEVAR